MKKQDLLDEINKGSAKKYGALWHNIGKFVYATLVLILCVVTLFMKVAF